jgi:hypothetical protein
MTADKVTQKELYAPHSEIILYFMLGWMTFVGLFLLTDQFKATIPIVNIAINAKSKKQIRFS